jgi:hypothetical protein
MLILPFEIAFFSCNFVGKLCALEPCPADFFKQLPKLIRLFSCDKGVTLLMLLALEPSNLSLHILVLSLSLSNLGCQLSQALAF